MSMVELLVGDAAPKLQLAEFLKGDPIDGFAPGSTTVVEFWSNTCGPCVSSIPHLTALQAAYPQVTILGVAVLSMKDVRDFVHEQGEAMAYRVAMDSPPADGERFGPTFRAWCEASYQPGIPASFIVDGDGRIAWIGHPMSLDEPLAAIVEGRWDLAAAIEEHEAMLARTKARETARMFAEIERCRKAGDTAGLLRVYDETFAAHPDLEAKFVGFKLQALFSHDQSEAIAYARHQIASAPGDDSTRFQLGAYLCSLAQYSLDEGKPVDSAVTAFATAAVLETERAVLDQADGDMARIAILETLGRALLTGGQADAGQARARAARDLAGTAGLSPERLARLDALLERCAAATAEAAAPPDMVCADGVCRIA